MTLWDSNQPIYLQLRQLVAQRILRGDLPEEQPIPSVRQVAADERINPLTVSRAYQLLVDEGLLEKRRGLGMFVLPGAQARALEQERSRFKEREWPKVIARIQQLGLSTDELLALRPDDEGKRP